MSPEYRSKITRYLPEAGAAQHHYSYKTVTSLLPIQPSSAISPLSEAAAAAEADRKAEEELTRVRDANERALRESMTEEEQALKDRLAADEALRIAKEAGTETAVKNIHS